MDVAGLTWRRARGSRETKVCRWSEWCLESSLGQGVQVVPDRVCKGASCLPKRLQRRSGFSQECWRVQHGHTITKDANEVVKMTMLSLIAHSRARPGRERTCAHLPVRWLKKLCRP
jgi:hypothetical protein